VGGSGGESDTVQWFKNAEVAALLRSHLLNDQERPPVFDLG
jgi:hypothetical protein